MNNKTKMLGQVKLFFVFALIAGILLAVTDGVMFVLNIKAGIIMFVLMICYILLAIVLYFYFRKTIHEEFVAFGTEFAQVQRKLIKDHIVPYALLDEDARIMWMNNAFSKLDEKELKYKRSITAIFPGITKELLKRDEDENTVFQNYHGRVFRINLKKIYFEEFAELGITDENPTFSGCLYAVFIYDDTQLSKALKENEDQQLVTGLIYLDNYEEALETVATVKRSMLSALVDRRINQYIEKIDGIAQKIEKDKYFIAFKKNFLSVLEEDRFSILDDVKTINLGNDIAVTLSIGIGVNENSYLQSCEYARMAIDLALGRGGDQAVIKEKENNSYYGGKTKQIEKSTRVKARVKAHALREIMLGRDQVVIMGHQIGDIDSFGSAVGVYRAAIELGKKAHIVLNEVSSSLRPFVDYISENSKYPDDIFVNSDEALELVNNQTVLIVVDVNRPSYTECPQILTKCRSVVVIDHHRQSSEVIDNAVLSYVEPYASSASEMVAEILQYFSEGLKMEKEEADCLFAGIMLDTNNFMSKTGVRTFEAAAYLRRCGADVTRVRKMFRNDMESYQARAAAVKDAEVHNGFAISVCPSESVESPTVVGAQAANELLNIIGVKASVVLTEYNGKIYVSSRSIDEINVQVLMEQLGGGGHMNIAGAQIEGVSIPQAKEMIIKLIDDMSEKGDI
ncbi:c-di-AMP phosphodiesterase, consists of a GGDEF-like and DHH domains [Acetitomaculum ruminis DSM 5522]|uniref:Cyclic-di-AMP phosphodiesterase n=1 Tax=Acetitomaculum ruminis DSM 5522 TaxID=1120918 RepID=A0A1I0YTC8_9FIRM|nr:DHH family phosphoesterase [Acetitomaculum ruminis]SFB16237.1 c-di-AMP phosphodiesterase, consists of a GGDEF-like and DHH domains [Acetitomaculum ruminis DSM 5522]